MSDAAHVYGEFLETLTYFVDEVTSDVLEGWREPESDPGVPAAKLGPLAGGVVATLAARYAKQTDDRTLMESMKLDEILAYLGDRLQDHEVVRASRAAARILAVLRWSHYGEFARPSDEEDFDVEDEAGLLEAGLERLMHEHQGGRSG
jgi:hypothetical protein